MRLIDANELKKSFIGNRYGIKAIDYQINNTPTIEAIPIEWIKNWVANIKNHPRYKNEYIEDLEEISKIVYRHGEVVLPIPCVSDMLKDWEKENGQETTN